MNAAPAAAHAAKLGDVLGLRRRAVLVAVSLALIVGIFTSMTYTLSTGYADGAYNYGDWIFRRGAETPYDAVIKKMQNPFEAIRENRNNNCDNPRC